MALEILFVPTILWEISKEIRCSTTSILEFKMAITRGDLIFVVHLRMITWLSTKAIQIWCFPEKCMTDLML